MYEDLGLKIKPQHIKVLRLLLTRSTFSIDEQIKEDNWFYPAHLWKNNICNQSSTSKLRLELEQQGLIQTKTIIKEKKRSNRKAGSIISFRLKQTVEVWRKIALISIKEDFFKEFLNEFYANLEIFKNKEEWFFLAEQSLNEFDKKHNSLYNMFLESEYNLEHPFRDCSATRFRFIMETGIIPKDKPKTKKEPVEIQLYGEILRGSSIQDIEGLFFKEFNKEDKNKENALTKSEILTTHAQRLFKQFISSKNAVSNLEGFFAQPKGSFWFDNKIKTNMLLLGEGFQEFNEELIENSFFKIARAIEEQKINTFTEGRKDYHELTSFLMEQHPEIFQEYLSHSKKEKEVLKKHA